MSSATACLNLDQRQDAWIAQCEADKRRRVSLVCMLRLGEIKRILKDREITAPAMRHDPAYAQEVLLLFVNMSAHLYGYDEGLSRVRRWCYFNCRWAADLIDAERVDLFSTGFPFFAAKCAQMMRLTYADRVRLKIKTIRPYDITWEQAQVMNKERRREKDRAYAEQRRREAGVKPQSESVERQKPWEAEGISRRTWYSRRKACTTQSDNGCLRKNPLREEAVQAANDQPEPKAIVPMKKETRHRCVDVRTIGNGNAAGVLTPDRQHRVFLFSMKVSPSAHGSRPIDFGGFDL